MLPANVFAPWLSVVPPLETTFLLLEQTWLVIAGWLALVVLSMRSDRRRGQPCAAHPGSLKSSETGAVAATGKVSAATRRAQWIGQKEAEQTEMQRQEQLSLHRRILAQGALWGSLWILLVFLLGALAVFCLALGTPLIGGLSADSLLRRFGCADPSLMGAHPLSDMCGFWTDRLEPYQRPWFGALLAPIWLFTQFSDVLLIWMASILLLALIFVYRLGWGLMFTNTAPAVKVSGLILFTAALLGLLYQLSIGTSAPAPSMGDSGLGGGGSIVELVFAIGAFVVFGLTAGLIALIVLVIALVRHFRRVRDRSGLATRTPVKPEPPAS